MEIIVKALYALMLGAAMMFGWTSTADAQVVVRTPRASVYVGPGAYYGGYYGGYGYYQPYQYQYQYQYYQYTPNYGGYPYYGYVYPYNNFYRYNSGYYYRPYGYRWR